MPDEPTCPSTVHPAQRLLPVVPGYQLDRELGRGGTAIVYQALDLALKREVAVKIALEESSSSQTNAERFERAVTIGAQLEHPGIPPIYAHGTLPDGRHFLAMKLIKGSTLDQELKPCSDSFLARRRFLTAYEQVCQIIAYAHTKHVIHRDLKPANIMVGEFGEIQVIDWGLTKLVASSEVADDLQQNAGGPGTEAWTAMGTPAFMSPEQAVGARNLIGPRSDVFGLGAVLAVILSGHPPFTGSDEAVRVSAAQGKTGECFGRLDTSGADPELVALCKRCLATDPEHRPADAGEVAREVAKFRELVESRARQAELDRATAELERKAAEEREADRRKWLMLKCALATAVILLVVVTAAWRVAANALDEAETARANESATKAKLDREGEKTARRDYAQSLLLAQRAWQDGHIQLSSNILDTAKAEFRGWEWNYARRLCQPNLMTFRVPAADLDSAAYSPDNTRVATAGDDGIARVWDAQTGAVLAVLQGHIGAILTVAFNPDGTRVVTAGADGTARVWEIPSVRNPMPGMVTRAVVLKGHTGDVFSASFNPKNGLQVVTAGADTTARIWELPPAGDGRREVTRHRALTGHTKEVRSAAFSLNGTRIVTASQDGTGRVWDADSGVVLKTLTKQRKGLAWASFSPDGSRIVTAGGDDMTARVWDAATGTELQVFIGHDDTVRTAAFSPDGGRVLTASEDDTARVWDVQTGAQLVILKGHHDAVNSAQFSPDGRRVLTACDDGTARVWDARYGASGLALQGFVDGVAVAAFSPDGTRVVCRGKDDSVRAWDADGTEIPARKEDNPSGPPTSRPDGSRLLITTDGKVQLTDGLSGTTRLLAGHDGAVRSAGFSPDGSRVITAGDDKTARVWDAANGAELLTLSGHTKAVNTASFSPDGTRVVTASDDGTVRVWDSRPVNREFVSSERPQ